MRFDAAGLVALSAQDGFNALGLALAAGRSVDGRVIYLGPVRLVDLLLVIDNGHEHRHHACTQ